MPKIKCTQCGSTNTKRNGFDADRKNRKFHCNDCGAWRTIPVIKRDKTFMGQKTAKRNRINHYSLHRSYERRTDATDAIKTNVKSTAAITGVFDWKDKGVLADSVAFGYNIPIGIVNHMIERVLRANEVT